MRVVVVGASSGLGRCIGVGLAAGGAQVALMARRVDRLEHAVADAGEGAVAVACDVTDEACDVTDEASVAAAIDEAADELGGIDALVYTPAIGPLGPLAETDAATWARVFATNVTGAALVTAAALPHLEASAGRAVYLSSVSASETPPWPGLGAYAVSKAALDKLVEAWRAEHPTVGFSRVTVGDCVGGEGEGMTQFAADWDPEVAGEFMPEWLDRRYIAGCFIDVDELTATIRAILETGASIAIPSVVVAPRPAPA